MNANYDKIPVNDALLRSVLAIAHEAGQAIMKVYSAYSAGDAINLSMKDDASPLTQADLNSHTVIARALASLTPDIPVVSEEDAASLAHRVPCGRFWLIDPLDGTKEFVARNDEFTVNIALIQDGETVLGVVTAPALGLAYWGARGLGAYRQDGDVITAIHVAKDVASGRVLRVVASKSHMNEPTRQFIEQLGRHELIQAGSSLKFCRIAEGSADYYPRLGPTCEWDTAAAQAVVEAAGGQVCTIEGQPLRYGKSELLNPFFIVSAHAEEATGTPP